MNIIFTAESLLQSKRMEFVTVDKVLDKNSANDSLLLGDGRIVSYEKLDSDYSSRILFVLSIVKDSVENDKLIDYYNKELEFVNKCNCERNDYNNNIQKVDNLYISLIRSLVSRYKKDYNSDEEMQKAMDEKAKYYGIINNWYNKTFDNVKLNHRNKICDINNYYKEFHEELSLYLDNYVQEIEECYIYD